MKVYLTMVATSHTAYAVAIGSGIFLTSSPDYSTIAQVLQGAGEIVTWVITNMGSYLTFITSNPIILVLFLITLAGFAYGMLNRIWKSVG